MRCSEYIVIIVSSLITLFCFYVSVSQAQTINIRGVVKDTLANRLPSIQILLVEEENGNISAYTQTNRRGEFSLKVSKSGTYTLSANALSYEKYEMRIDIKTGPADAIILDTIVLKNNPVQFDEIIVQAERPVTVRGDTITYNVADFMQGNEEVAEDILKKLPGIEVAKNGKIYFSGQEVDKVMVEDSDLFGKGYELLTKNLGAYTINKVDVLQRYSEKKELRGLEESDKVALNLQLQEDFKHTLFGNSSLAYNTSNNHEVELFLVNLTPSAKFYSILNSNSVGEESLSDVNALLGENPLGNLSRVINFSMAPKLSLRRSDIGLGARRTRFNDSNMLSNNMILKPADNLEVKFISFLNFDKDRFDRERIESFETGSSRFTETENLNLTNKLNDLFGSLRVDYSLDEGKRVYYQGHFKKTNGDGRSNLVFNTDDASKLHDLSMTEHLHNVHHINRINKNNAIEASVIYRLKDLNEIFVSTPFFPSTVLFPGRGISDSEQLYSERNEMFDFDTKWTSRISTEIKLEGHAGFNFFNSNLRSNLFEMKSNELPESDLNFDNHTLFNGQSTHVGLKARFGFGDFSFYSGLDAVFLKDKVTVIDKEELSQDNFSKILNPNAGFLWKMNQSNEFRLGYIRNATTTAISDLTDGLIFTGDRSFTRGIGSFEIIRGHSLIFQYRYGEWFDRFLLNTSILYNKENNLPFSEVFITPEFQIIEKRKNGFQETFMALSSADFFLSKIKSNFKFSGNYSNYNTLSSINETLFNFSSNQYGGGIEAKSVFRGFFNYNIGSRWTNYQLKTQNRRNTSEVSQYIDLYFDISDKINVQIITERFRTDDFSDNKSWIFLDSIFDYIIKPNKWRIRFEARNLLNQNKFQKFSISDFRSESVSQKLVSRYLLVSLNLRI